MKAIWLLGVLSLVLMVAYDKVAGTSVEAARGPNLPGPFIRVSSGNLPEGVSEYVFLHQTRDESIPVHTMAGVNACPG